MRDEVPLSRPVEVGAIPAEGLSIRIEADASERAALARAFDLLALDSLVAELAISPWLAHGFAVEGRVRASLVQRCVVSLVPVAQRIDEPVSIKLLPEEPGGSGGAGKREIAVDAEREDPPDRFSGHSIDLGAIAAEHVALALDPYPRAPGAELPAEAAAADGEPADSPFSVLDALRSGSPGKR